MDNGTMTDIDKRTRGMGGSTYASCGEENLLQLPEDRYAGGYDICMHEFSHTIMNIGFDSLIRKKIENQYYHAIEHELWKGAYASANPQEYWAELTTWYFGSHGDYLKGKLPKAGPQGLKEYDINGYNLLDSIYSGLIQPKTIQKNASVIVSKGVPSDKSDQKAQLSVFNNKAQPIKLYWIDWNAKPQLYKSIAAHTKISQSTFMSSVWMIEDDKGQSLLYIKVKDVLCELQFN